MKTLSTIGKLIYAIPLLIFGFGHLGNANSMTGTVPSYFPYPVFWVYLTGVALVLAALAIIINKKARLAAILLGIMLTLFAVLIHMPNLSDMQTGFPMFLKDLALAGSAFFIAGHSKN